MRQLARLSLLWRLRLGVGFVGFLAGISFLTIALVGGDDWPSGIDVTFVVAYLTVLISLLAIIAIELVRFLVFLLVFIGRRTGLLNHPT